MSINTKAAPLVILGFDGGHPEWLEGWAKAGHLPALAAIMERGCWSRTIGPELICEHGIWFSLLSGISRGEHGAYNFRQLKPNSYDLETVTGRDIDLLPFWSHLKGRDKKVVIIDAPDTYPIAGLPGIQLADWAVHNPLYPPSTEPADFIKEVNRIAGPPIIIHERIRSHPKEDRQIYRQMMERIEKKGVLCRHLLKQNRFDLVVIVFAESHTGAHQFWKYLPNGSSEGQDQGLANAIFNIYQAIDKQIGQLVAQLPNEANILIVSPVGMMGIYPTGDLHEAFCRQLGYQVSPEPASGPPSLRPMDLARRILPESIRIALSRYLSRERREHLLAEQFKRSTDWRKTIAFAIPSTYAGFLRVNLRGREPEGIVTPGAEYESLLQRLEEDLMQLVDPHTGQTAVQRVTHMGKLFGYNPPHSLPDLLVDWKPTNYFLERVIHPKAELKQQEPEFFRDSNHSQAGFIAATGPSIKGRGALGDISLLDLVPQFLYLMDEPIPHNLTGKVIEEMIQD